MPTIIAEGPMRASLESASEAVDITTPEGRTLGVFTPVKYRRSPYSREEIERRRAEFRRSNAGRSLDEIVKELNTQHGE